MEVNSKPCEFGMKQCNEYEVCYRMNSRRRHGVCRCIDNYTKNHLTGKCELNILVSEEHNSNSSVTLYTTASSNQVASTNFPSESEMSNNNATVIQTTTTPPTHHETEKLVVSIANKTVELSPGETSHDKPVTLSAYAIGNKGNKFEWTALSKPSSDITTSISDSNTQTITLQHLVPGAYVFKVAVDAPGAYGEAIGNVTVLPAQRVNKPPVAVIVPPNQTVKLPNSGVILDGSGSTDDDEVVSYLWEIVTGPLGYKLDEETGHTLKLTKLIPGNYTIMLKVKDKKNLEGNTTAFVFVVKETDYPPTANAGGDQMINLPLKEIVLNGNASSDDHGIVEWEWTKGPEDSGKAVDMQDTRTPYLKLSNLKEGLYHFILKVVDNAGQSATSSAHVYVHESNLSTPVANIGSNITTVLPVTSVTLDATRSSNISPQTNFRWKQLSGPSTAHLSATDLVKVNATDLTKGFYIFQLTVWNGDNNKKNSTANLTVTVLQNENVPPKANAGGDFSVTLPLSVLVINGSESTDDVGVTKWVWERDSTSLAAGKIINNSNGSSVLMLTDVVAGRYVWKLTVLDDQGATSSDTVSIIVKESKFYLIIF